MKKPLAARKATKPKRKPILRHSREGMKSQSKRATRKKAPH